MWVGTGESWTRNSVSVGDGVYKSTDGGETWTNVGLPNASGSTRIIVHPKNGNIVYVCAPGALWSDSPDRGLYKTTDGGKTWSLILKGAQPVDRLLVGGDGPGEPGASACRHVGLPSQALRISLGRRRPRQAVGKPLRREPRRRPHLDTISTRRRARACPITRGAGSRSRSRRRTRSRSTPSSRIRVRRCSCRRTAALTWEERDRSQGMVWRPFYFGRIVVDPKDPKRLFKMGYSITVSEDGGKSFSNAAGGSHGDWHDIWINPANTKYIVGGDDGGLWYSYDGANRWWKANNLPVSQFYHVSTDNKDPYQVYGGLQDNSSWVGDQEYPGGITNNRWENLFGGDGFWAFSDPSDPNYAYAEYQGGHIGRINRKTLEQRDIQPKGGYKEKLRYNWNTPIALSPNEKGTIYIGSQFLFRSRDHGVTWDRISPDLSTNDPIRQRQEESGGITVDNSSAEMNTTIYSISESPRAAGQIWVGTDDGNVQLTRDGGAQLDQPHSEPRNAGRQLDQLGRSEPLRSCGRLCHRRPPRLRRHDALSLPDDRLRPDLAAAGRTGNAGRSRLRARDQGRPAQSQHPLPRHRVRTVRQPRTRGASWAQFKPNDFPDGVAVRDIALQDRDDDLVLATHGRGIWVIDDISPLRALSAPTLASTAVLIPGKPVEQRIQGNGGWAEGDASYAGDNPASGAPITYYQKARHVIGRMKLEILDANGNVVDEVPASKRRGLNRVNWSMRTKPPQVPPAASLAGASAIGERFLPGTYTVRLTKAGQVSTAPLILTLDKRATFTVADRQAQFAAVERVKGMFGRMSKLVAQINGVRGQAAALAGSATTPADVKSSAAQLNAKADALRKEIVATKEGGAITGEERLREHVDDVYGAINSVEDRPTNYQMARVDALDRELKDVEAQWAALQSGDLATFNAKLRAANLPAVTIAEVELDKDPARGGRISTLVRGLVGTHFYGDFRSLQETGEKD